jgi:hypothetical protein
LPILIIGIFGHQREELKSKAAEALLKPLGASSPSGAFTCLQTYVITVDVSSVKIFIAGLILLIALLIYVAPEADEAKANMGRAVDQYERQVR